MVKPQKVLSILNSLRGYREKLGQLAAVLETKFLRDFTKVESAKHLLQISIESCIDIAHHIIADNGYRAPQDGYDAFNVIKQYPASFGKRGIVLLSELYEPPATFAAAATLRPTGR